MTPETNKVNVLHILGSLRPSGMERMLVSGASHFRTENIANTILGQGEDQPFASELRAAGYPVRISAQVSSSWAGVRYLRRIVRELDIDVIHIHTESDFLRTALACRLALGRGGGIVRTVHNVFLATGKWRATRWIQAAIGDRLLASLIAPSPDVAKNERAIGRRIVIIYNWVDDRFQAIRTSRSSSHNDSGMPPVGLIVGNCSRIKNHDLALRAIARSTHSLIHLGDETGASEDEIKLLNELERNGRLLDRGIQTPDTALMHADYFVMPSRHEGMGVALAEALVAGVPALVTDVPGLGWTRDLIGVNQLPETQSAWNDAIAQWHAAEAAEGPGIDLSAARGIREYAEIYRAAAK